MAVARRRGGALAACAGPGAWPAALAGAAAVAAYQACFFSAVATTGVALGTVVAIGAGPILAGALGLLIGETVDVRWAVATVLAVAGGACLLLAGRAAAAVPAGVLLALGAGAAYAALTVAARHLVRRGHDGADVMAVFFAGGAVPLALSWVGRDLGSLTSPTGLATIAWLGVGATTVPYLLFARGLRRLPAATATTLGLAEPLTAAGLGVALLGERPGPAAWLGAGLIAAGLLALAVPRRGLHVGSPKARSRAGDA